MRGDRPSAPLGPEARTLTADQSLSRTKYDLRLFKSVNALGHREIRRRLVFLAIASAFLFYTFNSLFPLLWYAVYAPYVIAHSHAVGRQPDQVTGLRFGLIAASDAFVFVIYSALGAFLWVQPEELPRILAIFLLCAAYLLGVGDRSREPVMLRIDIGVLCADLLFKIGWMWYADPGSTETITFSICLILLQIYATQAFLDAREIRQSLHAAHEERIQEERMQAVGRLTGGIAHDFNNLLTAVLGNIELLRMTSNLEEREALLSEAEKAARNSSDLTAQLLAYSQKAPLRRRDVDIAQFLREFREFGQSLLRPGQGLRVDCAEGLPLVRLDPDVFQSALGGLVENAAQAMDETGIVTLSCSGHVEARGQGVTITVRDRGTGISKDILPLVFEPYFTTRAKGRGTGLGLPMVKGIVEQSGGSVELVSVKGAGTEVHMRFLGVEGAQS